MASSTVLALVAMAALLSVASADTAPDQNSFDSLNRTKPSCVTTYQNVIETPYYANNPTCKTQVMLALETYVKAQCPSTAYQSDVWRCMSGWDGTKVSQDQINAWKTFLSGCEVLYIANRVNTGESESGFTWVDNSCFPRFNDMSAFVSYLSQGTAGNNGGDAAAVTANLLPMLFAALSAVMALLLVR